MSQGPAVPVAKVSLTTKNGTALLIARRSFSKYPGPTYEGHENDSEDTGTCERCENDQNGIECFCAHTCKNR